MKRKIFLLCLAAALLATVGLGSLAYRNVTETADNVITAGNLRMELLETTADGKPYPKEPMVIMPGDVISKVVTVKNTGTNPLYLRIRLTPGVNDADLTAANCIQLDINDTDWTQRNGYYYYNTALESGQTTKPLFTQVSFLGDQVTNAYLGKMFSLDVKAFAVQTEHNGTSPFTAMGWPEA